MKTRKILFGTIITASLLLSGAVFADSLADMKMRMDIRTAMQEAYEYDGYFASVKDPHTLAGAIYKAMQKDPVAATAAYRAFMIANSDPFNRMNHQYR